MRVLVASLIFLSVMARAEGPAIPLKTLELEWEPVPKADGYEVRLTPPGEAPPLLFTVKESKLQQEVPVGVYQLEIRSKSADDGALSSWSSSVEVAVENKETVPLKPVDGSLQTAEDRKSVNVEFAWVPVTGVKEYTLKVWSEARKDNPWIFATTKTNVKLNIPPGEIYHWQVFFDSVNSVLYNQSPPTFTFILQGMKLVRPEITSKVIFGDVKLFSWKKSPGATEYYTRLSFRHLDVPEYTLLREEKVTALEWPTQRLPAGQYKLEVQARGPKRAPSDFSEFEFYIKPTEAQISRALSGEAVSGL